VAWINEEAFANTCSAQQHRKLHHAPGREGDFRLPAPTHRADAGFDDWAFFGFAGRTSNCAEPDQWCFSGDELPVFGFPEGDEESREFSTIAFDHSNVCGVERRCACARVDLDGDLVDAEIGQRDPFLPTQNG